MYVYPALHRTRSGAIIRGNGNLRNAKGNLQNHVRKMRAKNP